MVFILGILQNGYSVKKPCARSFFTMVQMAFVRCSDGRCPFGSSCLFDGLLLQCWHAYQTESAAQAVRFVVAPGILNISGSVMQKGWERVAACFVFWPAAHRSAKKQSDTGGALCVETMIHAISLSTPLFPMEYGK